MYITIFFLQERVAIGRCLHRSWRAYGAACSGHVFDNHGLSEAFAEMLRDDAGRYIGAASQGKATMILSG